MFAISLRGLFFNWKVVSNMIVEIWNKNAGLFNSLVAKDRKVLFLTDY
jgi:ABC-type polysaccharide transport system permease subunit